MKRVIVAPLDWGLGHAARCVPVIRVLLQRSCTVLLAGSGESLDLLRQEFPALAAYTLPGYRPSYPRKGVNMPFSMLAQLRKFVSAIRDEHDALENMVRQHKAQLVVSDNRYGCWSAQVPSIFMTHQSNILMPQRFGWLSPWVRRMNARMMRRFTECWIPDDEQGSLAGNLASFDGLDTTIRRRYVGPLSRFTTRTARPKRYDILCVLSGPEPQRTMLEDIVWRALETFKGRACVVRGLPAEATTKHHPVAEVFNFMNSTVLQQAIESAAVVLARSGFSTVMDMARVGGKVIFVPTPGQTEQQYLAQRLRESGIACSVQQDDLNLDTAMAAALASSGFVGTAANERLLADAVTDILSYE